MAMEVIKAKDLEIGQAVMFFDNQWHRATRIEWAKGKREFRVYDSRGYSNVLKKDADIVIDRSL